MSSLIRRLEQKMDERIMELAAALWSSAGRNSGRDLDFWLMAERMIRQDLEWRRRGEENRPT
jgi:hypothetical protein